MEKRTFEEWEKVRGVLLKGEHDLAAEFTEEEWHTYVDEHVADVQYVDHDWRVKFLEANGYEVTRENMVDVDLPARQKSAEEQEGTDGPAED